MPKSLNVNPAEVRKASTITVPPIPVNAYVQDFAAAKQRYGADGLVAMLHDMLAIREFETMLNSIKTTGGWQGIEYNHKGPAHLSMGQEASAVGQAAELDADDYIFGSHRSHGEILAKSFSAARKLDPAKLQGIMSTFLDGDTLRYAEKIGYDSAEELTENFILFGTLAEIFARKVGFNRGMGGSMHAFFTPFGSMPNNAIVGGSAPIANGSALFKRVNRRPGIVISNIGDASMGCGPVWEAMMFAAMDQFRQLWRDEDGGSPPILFNFFNNFYG
ncbi:MAG TPA: thiamine pyrophosphate-dependent enzyme, partial [Propionicimonas sp.]|nr:thiamine pyrophosphate-dependent enzyme [Propionicimonas sp.]